MRPARVVAPTTVNGLRSSRRAARRRPAPDHHVDREVLHRRVEDLLDRVVEAMDLVDEQDIALFEVGQDCGKVARPLDRWTARGVQVDAQLAGDDVGERRLAEAGRAVKKHVVRGLAALPGGFEEDLEVRLDALLADILGQEARPQRRLRRDFLAVVKEVRRDETRSFRHAAQNSRIPAIRTDVLLVRNRHLERTVEDGAVPKRRAGAGSPWARSHPSSRPGPRGPAAANRAHVMTPLRRVAPV